MATTSSSSSALASVGLLLSCVALSLVTSVAVHLYFHAAEAAAHSDVLQHESESDAKSSERAVENENASAAVSPDAPGASVVVSDVHEDEDEKESLESDEPAPVEQAESAQPQPTIELRHLPADDVPETLRIDAFIAPEHQQHFEHATIFKECAHVFAVLDAIHPYLVKFFDESAWMQASVDNARITILKTSAKRDKDGRCLDESDDGESSEDDSVSISHLQRRRSSRSRSHWRLPDCIDPEDNTEILLYPGVNSHTFAPEKIINLPSGSTLSPGSSKSPTTTPRSPTGRRYSYARSSLSMDFDADESRLPKKRIVVLPGALILGGTFDVSDGSVFIGKNVRIEPNVYIKGPAVIGEGSTVRGGAYIRGDVIVGQSVVLRGELKNALILDHAELCHPGYCGDSVCGVKSHFGNQVTTANLNLFSSSSSANLTIDVNGQRYDTGRKKVGVILGDHSQLGCSTVTDPCTLLHPNTIAYPLSRLRKGIYGPNQIIKNKPMEKGVLEVAPLR
ncbi:Bifunctional glmu protein, partial [Globisporangium splendens]